jgi:hypothetical protein
VADEGMIQNARAFPQFSPDGKSAAVKPFRCPGRRGPFAQEG